MDFIIDFWRNGNSDNFEPISKPFYVMEQFHHNIY